MTMKKLFPLLLALLVTSCAAPKYGRDNTYVTKSAFIKADIAPDELLIESDYDPCHDVLNRDLYFKLLAAKLALQKGYTHFSVLSVEAREGSIWVRPIYYEAHLKFYKENPPPQAIKAAALLEFNKESLFLLGR